MDHQDWNPVILNKRPVGGRPVIQERRSESAQHMAKLDREEITKPKMLAPESRMELVQRRLALKLTQVQLDQQCAFPAHTINALESNKRAPTSKELQTLNRVLKCGLKLA
jgi:DNA-binding transcriptional regulator YiaG